MLWKAAGTGPTYGTPLVTKLDGEEVVITPAGDIVRLVNGEHLCSGLFESKYTTPLIEGNVLYVVDSQAKALELPAKVEKGMRLRELWKTKLSGGIMASPVFRSGLLYTIDNQKCRLHIIDAKTGEVLTVSQSVDEATKTEKIEPGVKIVGLATAQYVYASPTASEKNVYFFDDAGNSAVLELGRKYKLVRVNKLKDGCVGTPFFIDDKIIIRGTNTVYCIGAKQRGK